MNIRFFGRSEAVNSKIDKPSLQNLLAEARVKSFTICADFKKGRGVFLCFSYYDICQPISIYFLLKRRDLSSGCIEISIKYFLYTEKI